MLMKRHFITNALCFIFYEENIINFGDIVLQKPPKTADIPMHIAHCIKRIWVLSWKGFSSPVGPITTWTHTSPASKLPMAEHVPPVCCLQALRSASRAVTRAVCLQLHDLWGALEKRYLCLCPFKDPLMSSEGVAMALAHFRNSPWQPLLLNAGFRHGALIQSTLGTVAVSGLFPKRKNIGLFPVSTPKPPPL